MGPGAVAGKRARPATTMIAFTHSLSQNKPKQVAASWEDMDRAAAPSSSSNPKRRARVRKLGSGKKQGSSKERAGAGEWEGLTEEDRVNLALVGEGGEGWVSSDEEDGKEGGVCKSKGEGIGDLEDLRPDVAAAVPLASSAGAGAGVGGVERKREMVTPMQVCGCVCMYVSCGRSGWVDGLSKGDGSAYSFHYHHYHTDDTYPLILSTITSQIAAQADEGGVQAHRVAFRREAVPLDQAPAAGPG